MRFLLSMLGAALATSAATAADLGTKPVITIVGDPQTAQSGPSWVSASLNDGAGFALTQIQMGYFFEISGPSGFIPVPVFLDYALSGSVSPSGATALSSIKVITNGTSGPTRTVSTGPGRLSYALTDSMALTLTTNAAYPVYLIANVGTQIPGASASAYADPYIHIDADWLQSHPGYAVRVTPGIINQVAAPVPEPSVWLLLTLGIGVLGALRKSGSTVAVT